MKVQHELPSTILLIHITAVNRCVLLGRCRRPSQWAGAAFAARDDGLCWEAESWKLACLQELDIEGVFFSYIVSLPRGLERAAFRNAYIAEALRLDKCKCASIIPMWKHGAGPAGRSFHSLSCGSVSALAQSLL